MKQTVQILLFETKRHQFFDQRLVRGCISNMSLKVCANKLNKYRYTLLTKNKQIQC